MHTPKLLIALCFLAYLAFCGAHNAPSRRSAPNSIPDNRAVLEEHPGDANYSALEEILHHYDEDGDGGLNEEEFDHFFDEVFPSTEHADEEHNHAHSAPPGALQSSHLSSPIRSLLRAVALPRRKPADIRDKSRSSSHRLARRAVAAAEEAECPHDDDLFEIYDLDESSVLNTTEITAVSVEMTFMVALGCQDFFAEPADDSNCDEPEDYEVWLAALGATLFISFVSTVGVVLLPLQNREHLRHYVMVPLVSFASGTLIGDAVIHLLPESLGAHGHDHGGEEEEEEEEVEARWPALVCCFGVFSFFLLEKSLEVFLNHGHSHLSPASGEHGHGHGHGHSSEAALTGDGDIEMADDSEKKEKTIATDDASEKKEQIKNVGWMNIFSDGLHNLTDGLALGAAYSSGLNTGFATTLAVFFHELPQEIGDYAILIHAGFSRKKAILFNLLSGLTAVFGCIIGVGVGSAVHDSDRWLLAFVAGNFLYIALTSMLPEINQFKGKLQMVMQGAGLLVGFMVMLALTYSEESFESATC